MRSIIINLITMLNVKQPKTTILVVIALLGCSTNAVAEDIETYVAEQFTLNSTGWNKVFQHGDPVTIFSFKQESDIYSIGIYSNDYAGIINTKKPPFNVELKQLKKLPSNSKKKLAHYTEMACANARKKALAGKYKTIANDLILSNQTWVSVSKGDPMTVVGYKEEINYVSRYYYYAIVNNDAAGICYSYDLDKITIDNVPLPFLPSTSDPQVQAFIKRENQRIQDQKAAEMRGRNEKAEEERRLAAERKARQAEEDRRLEAEEKARLASAYAEEQKEKLSFLRNLSPAYIQVTGWNMDSAGGIAVDIRFTNCSSQRVKYVYFRGYFLNAVGDRCRNDITGSTEWKYRGVGPISPLPKTPEEMAYAHIESWRFGNPLFYSTIAVKFRLSSVTIEYMNGKKTVLSGTELKKRVWYAY